MLGSGQLLAKPAGHLTQLITIEIHTSIFITIYVLGINWNCLTDEWQKS